MKNINMMLLFAILILGLLMSCGNGGNEAKPKDSLNSPAPARSSSVNESDSLKVDSLINDTVH